MHVTTHILDVIIMIVPFLVYVDIDECQDGNGNCSQMCMNTVGSYFCVCQPGFLVDGLLCLDIDECATTDPLYMHNCSDRATCSNTEGGFNCTCTPGFEGSGTECNSEWKRRRILSIFSKV